MAASDKHQGVSFSQKFSSKHGFSDFANYQSKYIEGTKVLKQIVKSKCKTQKKRKTNSKTIQLQGNQEKRSLKQA